MLSGSLRLNLDIDSKYTDDQLYDALHQVQLLDHNHEANIASSNSSATLVAQDEHGKQQNIFANLESEIKSGGEKSVQ